MASYTYGPIRWLVPVGVSLLVHAVLIGWFCVGSPTSSTESSQAPTSTEAVTPEASEPASTVKGDETEPAVTTSASSEVASAQTETRGESAREPETVYVVKKGDNLSAIARRHGCTLAELRAANEDWLKHSKSLQIGQKLKIPKK